MTDLRPSSDPTLRPPGALWRNLARLVLLAVLILGAMQLMYLIKSAPDNIANTALIGFLLLYALLIALPFVPGVELGASLLAMYGAEMALPVWGATVFGLTLAYLTGRHLPYPLLCRMLSDLRLTGVAFWLERIEKLPRAERLDRMQARLPRWLARITARFRHVTLALLINLPGNAVIGGGGGIALAAGLSRLFALHWMVLTLCIATAPVPLLVWVWGPSILPWTG